MTHSVRYM
ncbi:MAG: hypothetical protein KKG00_04055 [Bacteroidetes bacterium]|nr:hypothetical protein [Bacteroidota bacterium]